MSVIVRRARLLKWLREEPGAGFVSVAECAAAAIQEGDGAPRLIYPSMSNAQAKGDLFALERAGRAERLPTLRGRADQWRATA